MSLPARQCWAWAVMSQTFGGSLAATLSASSKPTGPTPSAPQEPSTGPSGRGNGARGNGGVRGGGSGRGPSYSGAASYGYGPGAMGGQAPHPGPPVGGFYVGSPPGGYAPPHMGALPMYGPPPAGAAAGPGVPSGVPSTAGFSAATYYPQVWPTSWAGGCPESRQGPKRGGQLPAAVRHPGPCAAGAALLAPCLDHAPSSPAAARPRSRSPWAPSRPGSPRMAPSSCTPTTAWCLSPTLSRTACLRGPPRRVRRLPGRKAASCQPCSCAVG